MADRLDAAGLSFADGYGQGTTNAFDEAAWLVLWKLGLEIDDLESVENRPVSPEDQAQVALLVDQLPADRGGTSSAPPWRCVRV